MFTSTIYALAIAALAVTALASWPRHPAPGRPAMLQAERTATRSPAFAGQAEYLPALFVEQERAAPIEPMPPQF